MRVLTDCADKLFDNIEFLIGRLEPGQTRQWPVAKSIPPGAPSGLRVVALRFLSDRYDVVGADEAQLFVAGLPEPRLQVDVAYREVAGTEAAGDHEGNVPSGKRVSLQVRVQNRGRGESGQIQVTLKNPLRKDVELVDARAMLDPLAPGAEASVTLSLDLVADREVVDEPVRVPLVVRDRAHHVRIEHELDVAQPWRGPLTLEEPFLEIDNRVPREPWRTPFLRVVGQAAARDGIQVVAFYRGNQKVDRLLPRGSGGEPGETLLFKTRLPLEPGPNRITVVCKSATGISSRRQIWVTAVEPE